MRLIADLHTHTISSGHAFSTVQEILTAAQEIGLEMVAITDHGPRMPWAPNPWYFGNIGVLPSTYAGIDVLRGIEANIIDHQGNLDLEPRLLQRLDIVLAGLHEDCLEPGNVEENTRVLVKAMANPLVDIIVHPGNPAYPVDQELIVQASKDLGVALEINNSSLCVSRKGSKKHCLSLAKLIARTGSLISLGSDAHWAGQVGGFTEANELLEAAGIAEVQVLNTSREKVWAYLLKRKEKKR